MANRPQISVAVRKRVGIADMQSRDPAQARTGLTCGGFNFLVHDVKELESEAARGSQPPDGFKAGSR